MATIQDLLLNPTLGQPSFDQLALSLVAPFPTAPSGLGFNFNPAPQLVAQGSGGGEFGGASVGGGPQVGGLGGISTGGLSGRGPFDATPTEGFGPGQPGAFEGLGQGLLDLLSNPLALLSGSPLGLLGLLDNRNTGVSGTPSARPSGGGTLVDFSPGVGLNDQGQFTGGFGNLEAAGLLPPGTQFFDINGQIIAVPPGGGGSGGGISATGIGTLASGEVGNNSFGGKAPD